MSYGFRKVHEYQSTFLIHSFKIFNIFSSYILLKFKLNNFKYCTNVMSELMLVLLGLIAVEYIILLYIIVILLLIK